MAFDTTPEFLFLVAMVALWLGDLITRPGGDAGQRKVYRSVWYERRAARIALMPPGWVFGVAWTVLYLLIAAAFWTFFTSLTEDADRTERTAMGWLLLVNWALNKPWAYVFFELKRPRTALAMTLGLVGTNAAILGLMGHWDRWLSFGLFAPYGLWSLFALYLNAAWVRVDSKMRAPVYSNN